MNNKIIYLLRNSETDLQLFSKSIQKLKTNFLPNNNYPIVVFHEDIPLEKLNKIEEIYGVQFIIQNIAFEIPKFLDISKVPEKVMTKTVGYRHMCRFYSGTMYHQEILKGTDYYLRLDNDSFINSPVEYDIFEYMKKNNFVYGYHNILEDNPQVVVGLWEACSVYSQTRKTFKLANDIPYPKIYYTNFEIAKFDWFLSPEYLDFYNFIDMLGGIYHHRWGDAPIKFLGIEMLLEDKFKHKFEDIGYTHGE